MQEHNLLLIILNTLKTVLKFNAALETFIKCLFILL